MKTIQLDQDDDINSVCDRLEWQDDRQTLLLLPEVGDLFTDGLDLVRLRRFADRLRLDVGLVTGDKDIARRAKGLGLPVFASEEDGLHSRRGWWRGRRRREQVGMPIVSSDDLALAAVATGAEVQAIKAGRQVTRRHWIQRYVTILLFFAAAAFSVILFSYLLPSATLTLKPKIIPAAATQLVLADPGLPAVDYAAGAIPARLLRVDQSWSDELKTTGSVIIPVAQARGKVVMVNLTEDVVEVPVGTELSDLDGSQRFQTISPVTMLGVVSSTTEVDVLATLPGPQANIPADSIVRVIGELESRISVNNPEPMVGGEVRQVAAVSQQDHERLRAQVLQFLQALAIAEMQSMLTEREFLPRDSMRVVEIYGETFSHTAGEATEELRLKLEGMLQGTAIDLTHTTGLVYEALSGEVSPGFTLVADGISYERGKILAVDDDGRVTFEVNGSGLLAADLELGDHLQRIAGQEPRFALAYLIEELPLRETPTITTWPFWFRRVPFRPSRIRSELLTTDN